MDAMEPCFQFFVHGSPYLPRSLSPARDSRTDCKTPFAPDVTVNDWAFERNVRELIVRVLWE